MGRTKSIGMAEARPQLTQLVERVSEGGEPYLIVSGSRVKAVLVGIDQYNDMVERLEDLSDSAELLRAELDQEPTMTFEEHIGKSKRTKGVVTSRGDVSYAPKRLSRMKEPKSVVPARS